MTREYVLKQLYSAASGSAAQVGAAVDFSGVSAHIDRREITFGLNHLTTAGSPAYTAKFQESSGSSSTGDWYDITLDSAISVTTDGLLQRFGKVTRQYVRAVIESYSVAGSANITAFALPVNRFS